MEDITQQMKVFAHGMNFACEIFKQAGMDVSVAPVSSDEYPAKAKRPSNSRMDKSKLQPMDFQPLPIWQDALKRD